MNTFFYNPVNTSENALTVLVGKTVMIEKSCFCRYRNFTAFIESLVPFMATTQVRLNLPKMSLAELDEEIMDPTTDPSYRKSLESAKRFISTLLDAGFLKLIGSEDERSEETILKYIMLNRTKKSILVLTQQKRLWEDITRLNGIRSVVAPEVQVLRLTTEGALAGFVDATPQTMPAVSMGAAYPAAANPINGGMPRPAAATPANGGMPRPAAVTPANGGMPRPAAATPANGGMPRPTAATLANGGMNRPAAAASASDANDPVMAVLKRFGMI